MTRIEEIKARYEAATDGPWELVCSKGDFGVGPRIFNGASSGWEGWYESPEEEDATFIAHSRVDLPWLAGIAGKARNLAKRIEMNVCWCEIIPEDEIESGKVCIPCQARALLAELEGK